MQNPESYLLIKGLDLRKTTKYFKEWLEMYQEHIPEHFVFRILQNERQEILLTTDPRLDDEYFFFLVNYMGLFDEEGQKTYDLVAFRTGNNVHYFPNQRMRLFMDLERTEHDDVFVVSEKNKHVRIDFGMRVHYLETKFLFDEPQIQGSFEEKGSFRSQGFVEPFSILDRKKRNWRLHFKIALTGLALLNVYGVFLASSDVYLIFGAVILVGWLLFAYEMLQHFKFFSRAFALSSLFLVNGLLLYQLNHESEFVENLFFAIVFAPVLFLSGQFFTRRAFSRMLKREPVVDNPSPSALDFVYTMTLIGFTTLGVYFVNKMI